MWSKQDANRDKVFVEKPIFQLIQKLEGLAPLSPSPQFLAYAEEESLRKGQKINLWTENRLRSRGAPLACSIRQKKPNQLVSNELKVLE